MEDGIFNILIIIFGVIGLVAGLLALWSLFKDRTSRRMRL